MGFLLREQSPDELASTAACSVALTRKAGGLDLRFQSCSQTPSGWRSQKKEYLYI